MYDLYFLCDSHLAWPLGPMCVVVEECDVLSSIVLLSSSSFFQTGTIAALLQIFEKLF